MKTFFHYKNKNRKENNANDKTDIIFSHYARDNHGIALLGCAKRQNTTYSMPWDNDLLDCIGCE